MEPDSQNVSCLQMPSNFSQEKNKTTEGEPKHKFSEIRQFLWNFPDEK